MKLHSPECIKIQFLLLALYQLIGGLIGDAIIIGAMSIDHFQLSGIQLVLYSVQLVFYSYSVYCGIYCFTFRYKALWHTRFNQYLQLLGFAVAGYAFAYSSGIYLDFGFNFSNISEILIRYGFIRFEYNIHREPERLELTVNLISLAILFWISVFPIKPKAPGK